jgi:hypothetical protein
VILDNFSNAIKIGKANNVEKRLADLQTSNPNKLTCIYHFKCNNEQHSFMVEKKLHNLFKSLHIRGEWFKYDDDLMNCLLTECEKLSVKNNFRKAFQYQTIFGIEEFGIDNRPKCYFYPELVSQILTCYEKGYKKTNPYRTMKFPTYGKKLLLPFSESVERVFISGKKHKENLELKKFLNQEEIILKKQREDPNINLECFLK